MATLRRTFGTDERGLPVKSLGLLVLRAVFGGLMIGHGGQKLFGWFGGGGIQGTAPFMESLGLKPGTTYASLAGAAELGGGALIAAGFLSPAGSLATIGSMAMAAATAHRDKPIWVTQGGPELPLTNAGIAAALALTGPGKLSLDALLHTGFPRFLFIPGLLGVGAAVLYSLNEETRQQILLGLPFMPAELVPTISRPTTLLQGQPPTQQPSSQQELAGTR